MPRYKPQSIEDIGLEAYLNRTKDIHDGLGYVDFKIRLEMGVPKTKLAEAFKVEKSSIHRWILIYEKEQLK